MERSTVVPPVGSSMPRVDGVAKVTGRARYLDDLDAPGVWYGATVRSTIAHGVFEGLTLPPVFDWSQVVVATADDIPGRNVVALIEDDQPALVPIGGRVMHVAEPLALIAAPTRALALEAWRRIVAHVRPLPALFTIDDSLAVKHKLYGDDNVFKQFLIRKGHATDAELEAAFAGAARVIEGVYKTSPQEQMYIEPQAMMAEWVGGRCNLVGSMQCPYYVHKAMKAFLGCDADGVVVTQAVTGGGFGGKEEYPSMLAAHVALLARKAGHPVKIVYDREEDIAATTKRHPARTRHRLAIDARGEIAAIDIDVVMDGGAYVTLSPVVLSRGVLHAAGPYRCPIVRVRGRVVATNHPPHGAFRGFGAPQTTFAYERQMQKLALARGEEPLALRKRLALRSGDTTATGQVLGASVGTDEVIAAIERVAGPPPVRTGMVNGAAEGGTDQTGADLRRTAAEGGTDKTGADLRRSAAEGGTDKTGADLRRSAAEGGTDKTGADLRRSAPVRRGRGVCFYFHGAGFTGSGEQRLAGRATVAMVDGRFEVRASSTDIGQGAITTFTQIAAAALGVDATHVVVVDPSTAQVPDSGPTVASRTCMVVGGVVDRASRAVRAKLEAWGVEHGLAGKPLVEIARAHRGEVAETVTYEPPPGIAWDDATYTGSAYPVFGWAACLVDVAVDLDSYEVTVERCVQAVDVGKAINPVIVRGQIEGGTLQALGWAVIENVVYRDGKVANANMTNCIVPTFADAPELETILVEVPYPFGPSGAKGVGEIPMDGPAAAVANAVEDALGCAFDEIPISPELVAASRPRWRPA